MSISDYTLDKADMQGLLATGYGSLPVSRFILLHVTEPEKARNWLRAWANEITSAAPHDNRSDTCSLNIAFTHSGLQQLNACSRPLEGFSREFTEGMTTAHRARLLGDEGQNDPLLWQWGGPTNERVDVLLMLYFDVEKGNELASRLLQDETIFTTNGFRICRQLAVSVAEPIKSDADKTPKEHFGFADGISQPFVEGLTASKKNENAANTVKPGEFVLGYPNQYDKIPYSPAWVQPGQPAIDFGKNGTYLVFRQLEQDVKGFWTEVRKAAQKLHGSSDSDTCLRVAAKWVGRWPGGTPVTLSPHEENPALLKSNNFMYHQDDAFGNQCPLGAHIRRANPRDALGPTPELSLDVANKHRLLRRGRVYGPPLVASMNPTDILAGLDNLPPSDQSRGLHFIALNANLSRQFEFVQHTWLQNGKFAGLYDDADPITGRAPFTIQGEPFARRTDPLPQFITVRGGAYFFLPSLSSIRKLLN